MKRLYAGLAVWAAAFAVLALFVDSHIGPSTPSVILLAGITCAALVVTMLASTRGWTTRAVGLLFMLTGMAVLLIAGYANYRWPFSDRVGEMANDVILAMWLVGGPLSLFGVGLYWFGRNEPGGNE